MTAPALLAVAAAYVGAYGVRARRLAHQGRPVPAWRSASFVAGVLVVAAALAPPLEDAAQSSFPAHMVQHLLLIDLGALLIVLGLTGPLLAPVLRLAGLRHLRSLGHPAVAVAVWAATLWSWHLPAAYEGALAAGALHAVEHGAFLLAGITLWLPLFGPFPRPAWFGAAAQLGYVLAVRVIGFTLANLFVWSGTPFYAGYAGVEEQSAAGAVMLVEESVVMVAVTAWLAHRWLAEAGERQELAELARARGVAVDAGRIGRAVAAGRGGELRRLLLRSPAAHDRS